MYGRTGCKELAWGLDLPQIAAAAGDALGKINRGVLRSAPPGVAPPTVRALPDAESKAILRRPTTLPPEALGGVRFSLFDVVGTAVDEGL